MLGNDRYIRQMALPEIGIAQQNKLKNTHIAMIGVGGLGCAALPYLASAGVGNITLYDDDHISRSNLHRQTLYKDSDIGKNKAEMAAQSAKALNPECNITAQAKRFTYNNNIYDLIIDGSDNFETKTYLNDISIKTKTPLISASVNQWAGQIGVFAGYAKNQPCYHCLFPELPSDAKNCNEAGILGTAAGITGLYQAHMALGFLIGLKDCEPGRILSFDFKTHRMQNLKLNKSPSCPHCKEANDEWTPQEKKMAELISMKDLSEKKHLIVDVRTDQEIANDPIDGAFHMELQTVPERYQELPKDKLLAFVCAGNIRSVQAAEYLEGMGFDNIIVLDKFSL
ncbi:MAG: ThiF family adenylyltransferase [Bdellovibrionales bacterium]